MFILKCTTNETKTALHAPLLGSLSSSSAHFFNIGVIGTKLALVCTLKYTQMKSKLSFTQDYMVIYHLVCPL